jgi:hypothetical protein
MSLSEMARLNWRSMSDTFTRMSRSGTFCSLCFRSEKITAALIARSSKSLHRSVFGWNTSTCGSCCPTQKYSVTSRHVNPPRGLRMSRNIPSSLAIRRVNRGARKSVVSRASCGIPGGRSEMNGLDASGLRSTTARLPPCVSDRPEVSPWVRRR